MHADIDLQLALNNVMDQLNQAMYKHLGKDIQFMVKLDIQLGVQKGNELKLKEFQIKLQEMLEAMPKEFNPERK